MKKAAAGLTFLLLLIAPRLAFACSCVGTTPACQAVFSADAVFVAYVESIRSVEVPGPVPEIPTMTESTARLRVVELFRGRVRKGMEITMPTGDGAMCGYEFSEHGTYLVYASDFQDHFTTSLCSRTRPLGRAAEDLAFLRNMSATPSAKGQLIGKATYIGTQDADGARPQRPFAGARISATSGSRSFAATSAPNGTYVLAVPPGEYKVTVSVPPGYYSASEFEGLTKLQDARGCAAIDVYVLDDGHVRGRVIDADGKPVPNLTVELGQRRRQGQIEFVNLDERTDADGRYEFSRLQPGDYFLGINPPSGSRPPRIDMGTPVFFPGVTTVDRAETISLAARATVDVPDLVVPESVHIVQVTGVVLTEDGQVAPGAVVYLAPDDPSTYLIGKAVVTGADGRFSFGANAGTSYKILASRSQGSTYESVTVSGVLASAKASVTVRMVRQR